MIAKHGSDELISCLNHLISQLPTTVTTLRLFSDGCSGQNMNVNVMHFLFYLVAQGRFQQTQHTFPVTGHSFLPNDRDFGRTEVEKRKNERIYVSTHYVDVIKKARHRKPFNVIPVDQSLILNFSVSFAPLFKKVHKSTTKSAVNIQKARVLDYSSEHVERVWVPPVKNGASSSYSKLVLCHVCHLQI